MPFTTEVIASGAVIGSTRFWKIDTKNRKLEIGSTWLSASWHNMPTTYLQERSSCQPEMLFSLPIKLTMLSSLSLLGVTRMQMKFLRDGLRLVERRESEDDMRLAALREAARVGIADIDAGAYQSFDSPESLGQHLVALASKVVDA